MTLVLFKYNHKLITNLMPGKRSTHEADAKHFVFCDSENKSFEVF